MGADLLTKGGDLNRPVHILNVEIQDNHEQAALAGKAMLDLCTAVRASPPRFSRSLTDRYPRLPAD